MIIRMMKLLIVFLLISLPCFGNCIEEAKEYVFSIENNGSNQHIIAVNLKNCLVKNYSMSSANVWSGFGLDSDLVIINSGKNTFFEIEEILKKEGYILQSNLNELTIKKK